MGRFTEITDAVKAGIDASKDRAVGGPVEQVIQTLVGEEVARRTKSLLAGVRKYPEFKGAVEKAKKQITVFTGQDGQKVELRTQEQTKALAVAETSLKEFETAFEEAAIGGHFGALDKILAKGEKGEKGAKADEASS